jgi:hypothetical protein
MAVSVSSGPDARGRRVALFQILILTLWLGAAAFFALVVAPAAFAALPSRELAGAVVGRVLPALFIAGGGVGLIALLLEALGRPSSGKSRHRRARITALCVVAIACGIAQLGVAPRIAALRSELSEPLASLPATSPQRIAFGRLHMVSVAWLGAAMLAAAAAVALAAPTFRTGDAS